MTPPCFQVKMCYVSVSCPDSFRCGKVSLYCDLLDETMFPAKKVLVVNVLNLQETFCNNDKRSFLIV